MAAPCVVAPGAAGRGVAGPAPGRGETGPRGALRLTMGRLAPMGGVTGRGGTRTGAPWVTGRTAASRSGLGATSAGGFSRITAFSATGAFSTGAGAGGGATTGALATTSVTGAASRRSSFRVSLAAAAVDFLGEAAAVGMVGIREGGMVGGLGGLEGATGGGGAAAAGVWGWTPFFTISAITFRCSGSRALT